MNENKFNFAYTSAKNGISFFLTIFITSFLLFTLYGYSLLNNSLKKLLTQNETVEAANGFMLPGSNKLLSLSFLFKFNSSMFAGIALSVLFTIIVFIIYLCIKLIKNRESVSLKEKLSYWISAAVLSTALLFSAKQIYMISDGMISFRNRILLTGKAGRLISDFYYTHSPYATGSITDKSQTMLRNFLGLGIQLIPLFGFIFIVLSIGFLISAILVKYNKHKLFSPIIIIPFSIFLVIFTGLTFKNIDIQKLKDFSKETSVSETGWNFIINKLETGNNKERFEAVNSIFHLLQYKNDCRKKCRSLLIKATSDEQINIRMITAGAIGNLGDVTMLPYLINLTSDNSLNVRYTAVQAIGKSGNKSAIPHLNKILKNDIWYVGIYTTNALDKLRRMR